MLSEMEMGISRRDAMRNLSDRNDVHEISSFVALILQADQLGMSISETLQAIAEQMRIERRFRAVFGRSPLEPAPGPGHPRAGRLGHPRAAGAVAAGPRRR